MKTKNPAIPRRSELAVSPSQHLGLGDRLEAGEVGVERSVGRLGRPASAADGPSAADAATAHGGAAAAAIAAATKTNVSKTSTPGAWDSVRIGTPGMAATNPASVPSSVSRAFSAA